MWDETISIWVSYEREKVYLAHLNTISEILCILLNQLIVIWWKEEGGSSKWGVGPGSVWALFPASPFGGSVGLGAGESRDAVNDREWPGYPRIHLAVCACRDALEGTAGKGWGAVRGGGLAEPEPGPAHAAGIGGKSGWLSCRCHRGCGTNTWLEETLSDPPSVTTGQVSLKVVLNRNQRSLGRLGSFTLDFLF